LAACSSGSTSAAPPQPAAACDDTRAISCSYFDVAGGRWSPTPPSAISLASACAPGGANGEIDAYVTPASSYSLDRVGFVASGTAVRAGTLSASDDAGGTSYACGQPAARIVTQLFCGKDMGAGTLELRFTFSGRWSDGSPWTQHCDARVDVQP
jgi:hypothetical protein